MSRFYGYIAYITVSDDGQPLWDIIQCQRPNTQAKLTINEAKIHYVKSNIYLFVDHDDVCSVFYHYERDRLLQQYPEYFV